MSKYLLPCECGKELAIDPSQAGQQLACECGKRLEVPTLRDVRALKPALETASASRQPIEWGSSRGLVFVGSLILCGIGTTFAYFGYDALRATPNITREAEVDSFAEAIDDMSLNEIYETWKSIREHGLGPRGQNVYVNIRSFRAGRQRMLVIGIVLCCCGLVGAIGSVLARRTPPAREGAR